MGSTRFRLSARGDQWLLRNHAGQRGVPTTTLEHPRDPTSAHSPNSRSSSSPSSADKADRWSCTRDEVYARAKTRIACTTAINRPRAIREPPEHESFDRNRPNAATTSSYHLWPTMRHLSTHPPPLPAPRARTYRRLSPPPCSLSLLSRCLTFFPLHHLILRPDPFPDRSSSSGGRTLPVVLIDNSRVSVKGMFVRVCMFFSFRNIFGNFEDEELVVWRESRIVFLSLEISRE